MVLGGLLGVCRKFFAHTLVLGLVASVLCALVTPAPVISAPGINQQINFQGRLLNQQGAVAPDGFYNIQFKIYQDGDGQAVGNPSGTLVWTEDHLNANSQGVQVKNGFMSVQLGYINAFGSSIDWNQDTLWLSMNIGDTNSSCTPFSSCAPDGEMIPMKRLSSTPYALNAGQLGGLTSAEFLQLSQGLQTDSVNATSININKTGTGDFISLQDSGDTAFTLTNSGDITFGNNADHTISVETAAASTDGVTLTVKAGDAGAGGSTTGGDLILQGGAGSVASGSVIIKANTAESDVALQVQDAGGNAVMTVDTTNDTVKIAGALDTLTSTTMTLGGSTANAVQIGNTSLSSGTQTINIGTNNTSGGTTDVTIGAGGNASGGVTTIQAKGNITINTNGTTRATFDTSNTLYLGNGASSATPSDFTISGTASSADGEDGGILVIKGGNATTGDANGGNVSISGGTGTGTGVRGLVIIDTPTFSTATTQTCGGPTPCPINQSDIDNFGAIVIDATVADLEVTMPDPTNSTAGRIVYVSAANGSEDFTLAVNGGGTGNEIAMRGNTTATMVWNGSDWTAAGASSSTTLQAAYNNTLTSAGGAEIVLNPPGGSADGLTIRNNGTMPITGGILEIQSSIGTNLFSVNNLGTELAANGGSETDGTWTTNWTVVGSSTVSQTTDAGEYVTGQAGVQVVTTAAANDGIRNNLSGNPVNTVGAEYQVSFTAKSSIDNTPIDVLYSRDGGTNTVACTGYGGVQNLSDTVWTKITCTIVIDSATAATDPDLIIRKTDTSAPTIWIDNLSFMRNDSTTTPSNVQIGGGINGGPVTLFTLDRSSAPPVANGNTTYLGSMYYDTTTGRIQCYEADGWGACGSAPDEIVTLTPEYTGAVLNGSGVGTLTADFCSNDTDLQVNIAFCASGLSRNYYRWTSPQATQQTYSIYVSYKLPSTFKQFSSSDTITLTALTDSTSNGVVDYQIFRSSGSAVTSCGSQTDVTSSSADTWHTVPFAGDEAACGFVSGDYIIFKINVRAQSNANVYVENLDFTYLNV